MLRHIQFERIETTYKNLHEMIQNNPEEKYYVKTHKGDLTKINASVVKKVNRMYNVVMEDGYEIECADSHALMDRWGKAVFVKDLKSKKRILSDRGVKIVKSVTPTENDIAYDINIESPHWYVNDDYGLIHHNTLLGLYCMKAYLDKYPDAICLFYDSEFGSTPEYLSSNGIDTSRVLHIPIEHVEQLKFDIKKRLNAIERGEKVFIFIDSIGNLASVKEVEDADNEKSVQDMSRAKAMKSLFRIITPMIVTRDIPCIAIGHTYKTLEMYSKDVLSGGTALMYSANTVFIITKAQVKEGTDITGYQFTININKSRTVREKSKFPFTVKYSSGISKYSGLLDIALEGKFVVKPAMGWYQKVDPKTMEPIEGKYREKDTHTTEFWDIYLKSPEFNEFINKRYKLGSFTDSVEDEVDEFEDMG